jgi:hypothetical protein
MVAQAYRISAPATLVPRRTCAGKLALLLGCALARTSHAEKVHRLHRVGPDSADLVVSVTWESDDASAPSKDYLKQAFRQFASRTQQMTLGHVSVCKVYVYFERRHADVADMIVADTNGQSNADKGGIRSPSRHMWLYRSGRGAETFGNVMAHELGHYGLNQHPADGSHAVGRADDLGDRRPKRIP